MPDFTGAHRLCEPSKSETRSRLLSNRREIFPPIRADADTRLVAELRTIVAGLVTASPSPERIIVAGYVPMAGEPGGRDLPAALAEAVRPGRLITPVLRSDMDLDWAEFTGRESLRPVRMGLLEPAGERLGAMTIAEADLVVVPAVAVDRTGIRLGRGGGSYDRALARVREHIEIIAPLYGGEFVARLPFERHDRRVTSVLVATGETTRQVRTVAG